MEAEDLVRGPFVVQNADVRRSEIGYRFAAIGCREKQVDLVCRRTKNKARSGRETALRNQARAQSCMRISRRPRRIRTLRIQSRFGFGKLTPFGSFLQRKLRLRSIL